jgi:phosphoribosylformimino-5-aminoimidazole carboxamide ribotide isomerase
MLLYPAIDIRDGHAVRLRQGDYAQETVFDADPLDAARRWIEQGAEALHVVDLDGAREGAPVNLAHVERICAEVEVPVQVGGGLRQGEDVSAVLVAGARHAVLGTAAISDPALIESLAAEHGDRITVSVDARGDRVAIEGWERETAIGSAQLVGDLARRGVRRFVCTPVDVDGTLAGPQTSGLREVASAAEAAGAAWIYSGGVGTLDHLRELNRLPLEGVIVGKAIYEQRFSVEEALAALW